MNMRWLRTYSGSNILTITTSNFDKSIPCIGFRLSFCLTYGDGKNSRYLSLSITVQLFRLIFIYFLFIRCTLHSVTCVPLSSCADDEFCRNWLLWLLCPRIVFSSLVRAIFKNIVVNVLKFCHWKIDICWENYIIFNAFYYWKL